MNDMLDHLIETAVMQSRTSGYTGRYRALGGGEINDTYALIYKDDTKILRIARDADQNSLFQEARALELLNISQVPELVYFDPDSRIDGRTWILESFIEGDSQSRLNAAQFRSLGRLLASVHRVTSGETGVDIWGCFLDECKMFGTQETLLAHQNGEIRQLILKAYGYFQAAQPAFDAVPQSLIHGDATPSNVLVSGDTVKLIDWEFSKFKDPMAEFSTIYYEDMEYNRGKWRLQITPEEKQCLQEGYRAGGGLIYPDRIDLWMNFDKLGAAVFLYWRIHLSSREASTAQMEQYKLDLQNVLASLHGFFG